MRAVFRGGPADGEIVDVTNIVEYLQWERRTKPSALHKDHSSPAPYVHSEMFLYKLTDRKCVDRTLCELVYTYQGIESD